MLKNLPIVFLLLALPGLSVAQVGLGFGAAIYKLERADKKNKNHYSRTIRFSDRHPEGMKDSVLAATALQAANDYLKANKLPGSLVQTNIIEKDWVIDSGKISGRRLTFECLGRNAGKNVCFIDELIFRQEYENGFQPALKVISYSRKERTTTCQTD